MDMQNSHHKIHNLMIVRAKKPTMSKYKSYNKKPIVKYIHNNIFLFIMMFSSFKEIII